MSTTASEPPQSDDAEGIMATETKSTDSIERGVAAELKGKIVDKEGSNCFAYKCEVKEISPGHLALCAAEFIPKGAVWWKVVIGVNTLLISRAQLRRFQDSERKLSDTSAKLFEAVTCYAFYRSIDDSLVLCMDNGRFVNHSQEPNSALLPDRSGSFALRDIKVGEEILENYLDYDAYVWPEKYNNFPFDSDVEPEAVFVEKLNAARAKYKETCIADPTTKYNLDRYGCYVAPSKYGCGLYCKDAIPKGVVMWNDTPCNNLKITRAAWGNLIRSERALSPMSQDLYEGVLTYAYYDENYDSLLLCLDNARFFNHSTSGNTTSNHGEKCDTVVAEAIPAGSEMVDNYFFYNECPWAAPSWEAHINYPRKKAVDPELAYLLR